MTRSSNRNERTASTRSLTNQPKILADKGCRVKNKNGYLYSEVLEEFLHSLPKVELHVHLDGSFEHDIIYQHLLKKGLMCLPVHTTLPWDSSLFPVRSLVEQTTDDKQKFQSLCICRGKRSLQEMIKCFEIFLPIVRGDLDIIEHLSSDFVQRQADQNIKYTEVRYSPHLLAYGGSMTPNSMEEGLVDARSVVDAVTRGLRAGERKCNYRVRVNQILCCITWRPDFAEDVVDICIERRNDAPCGIVGIDIAAGEEHFESEDFAHLHLPHVNALTRANQMGLNITIHAGEVDTTGENVLHAIQKYHATRVGHGYRIARSLMALDSMPSSEQGMPSDTITALCQELLQLQIHFEVCPTSSVETGGWDYDDSTEGVKKNWEEHPMVMFMNRGFNVGLNSDDPAVFDTSLTFQYRIAATKMRLSYAQLVQTVRNAIDASFAEPSVKQELHEELKLFCETHKHLLLPP